MHLPKLHTLHLPHQPPVKEERVEDSTTVVMRTSTPRNTPGYLKHAGLKTSYHAYLPTSHPPLFPPFFCMFFLCCLDPELTAVTSTAPAACMKQPTSQNTPA
jgi:hypothetical protein